MGKRTQRRVLEHNIQITGSDIGEIESVQSEAGSQLLTHLNSAYAVAVFVEPRGERRNTQLAINDCNDSTAHCGVLRKGAKSSWSTLAKFPTSTVPDWEN